MNKKKLFQGLVVGLLANIIGLITAAIVLGKLSGLSDNILTVLESAQSENFLGKLISLGAILNLLSFFYFIRKRQDARAGGVLAATILIALLTFLIRL
jgi:cell division protein FtsX